MANNKNLRTLSPSEARENGKKGGILSGRVLRRLRLNVITHIEISNIYIKKRC